MEPQVIVDRRKDASCHPCPHTSDIAVIKDRDIKTEATLEKILACNQQMLEELGRITLVEHQILAHREDIERLYSMIKEIVEKAAETKSEVAAWDNRIRGGWKVITVVFVLVGAMGSYIASDVKAKYQALESSVLGLNMTITNVDERLSKMQLINDLRKK